MNLEIKMMLLLRLKKTYGLIQQLLSIIKIKHYDTTNPLICVYLSGVLLYWDEAYIGERSRPDGAAVPLDLHLLTTNLPASKTDTGVTRI